MASSRLWAALAPTLKRICSTAGRDKGQTRRGGAMAEGYTIKRIDEFEEMEWSGGATWRLARKSLGAEAFGFNVVDIEAGGEIPAHDHAGDKQEEVFVILEGQGTIVTN